MNGDRHRFNWRLRAHRIDSSINRCPSEGSGFAVHPIRLAVLALTVAIVAGACAADDPRLDGPPTGDSTYPDLVPDPPEALRTRTEDDGRQLILFSSILTNIGEGDFLLDGLKSGDDWVVEQSIPYSESGSLEVPVEPRMVWGGDGHGHWHVARVAVNWVQALGEDGEPVEDFEILYDAKVGFCFFDSHHNLESGADDPRYDSSGCGGEDSNTFDMGLSVGWSDEYDFTLPGQEIEVTGLPDGMYRLWSEADPEGWFRESSKDNNLTWVNFELSTRAEDGQRLALVVERGPKSSDY